MMEELQFFSVGFYAWWLLVNGFIYLAQFRFVREFTGVREKRFTALYVLFSDLLTFGLMYFQSPGALRLMLHAAVIVCFSKILLRLGWVDVVAPMMIILTLSALTEGLQTVLMRWLVGWDIQELAAFVCGIGWRLPVPYLEMIIQMLVSGVLAILLILTLRGVSGKYAGTGGQKISSYLYALFFPCVFIVWIIRSGLGLDPWMNPKPSVSRMFERQPNLWALVWILGACAAFFAILRLIGRIITLSEREAEQERLEDQIRKQQVYLNEAKKRNEQYRKFQHDIDNHFLVLSGLIGEKRYGEAEQYFEELRGTSRCLPVPYRMKSVPSNGIRSAGCPECIPCRAESSRSKSIYDGAFLGIETGNSVVDILLGEKISYARANQIDVKCEARIPADLEVEDIDLCVILANAMDNAIQACVKVQECPAISIVIRKHYHFLIMEVINTLSFGHGILAVEYGTGLNNIKQVVQKYEGTMETEADEKHFRLTILLCLTPFAKGE